MKIVVKFIPTLGGFRPRSWRYKNGPWNEITTLKQVNRNYFTKLHEEIKGKVLKREDLKGMGATPFKNCFLIESD